MVRRVTLRQAGGSITVTIPKDMAEHHHMVVGDEGFAIDTDAGVLITTYDPAFAKTMSVFERGAAKYRNALRELAK
jgi:putative addiction module antidote